VYGTSLSPSAEEFHPWTAKVEDAIFIAHSRRKHVLVLLKEDNLNSSGGIPLWRIEDSVIRLIQRILRSEGEEQTAKYRRRSSQTMNLLSKSKSTSLATPNLRDYMKPLIIGKKFWVVHNERILSKISIRLKNDGSLHFEEPEIERFPDNWTSESTSRQTSSTDKRFDKFHEVPGGSSLILYDMSVKSCAKIGEKKVVSIDGEWVNSNVKTKLLSRFGAVGCAEENTFGNPFGPINTLIGGSDLLEDTVSTSLNSGSNSQSEEMESDTRDNSPSPDEESLSNSHIESSSGAGSPGPSSGSNYTGSSSTTGRTVTPKSIRNVSTQARTHRIGHAVTATTSATAQNLTNSNNLLPPNFESLMDIHILPEELMSGIDSKKTDCLTSITGFYDSNCQEDSTDHSSESNSSDENLNINKLFDFHEGRQKLLLNQQDVVFSPDFKHHLITEGLERTREKSIADYEKRPEAYRSLSAEQLDRAVWNPREFKMSLRDEDLAKVYNYNASPCGNSSTTSKGNKFLWLDSELWVSGRFARVLIRGLLAEADLVVGHAIYNDWEVIGLGKQVSSSRYTSDSESPSNLESDSESDVTKFTKDLPFQGPSVTDDANRIAQSSDQRLQFVLLAGLVAGRLMLERNWIDYGAREDFQLFMRDYLMDIIVLTVIKAGMISSVDNTVSTVTVSNSPVDSSSGKNFSESLNNIVLSLNISDEDMQFLDSKLIEKKGLGSSSGGAGILSQKTRSWSPEWVRRFVKHALTIAAKKFGANLSVSSSTETSINNSPPQSFNVPYVCTQEDIPWEFLPDAFVTTPSSSTNHVPAPPPGLSHPVTDAQQQQQPQQPSLLSVLSLRSSLTAHIVWKVLKHPVFLEYIEVTVPKEFLFRHWQHYYGSGSGSENAVAYSEQVEYLKESKGVGEEGIAEFQRMMISQDFKRRGMIKLGDNLKDSFRLSQVIGATLQSTIHPRNSGTTTTVNQHLNNNILSFPAGTPLKLPWKLWSLQSLVQNVVVHNQPTATATSLSSTSSTVTVHNPTVTVHNPVIDALHSLQLYLTALNREDEFRRGLKESLRQHLDKTNSGGGGFTMAELEEEAGTVAHAFAGMKYTLDFENNYEHGELILNKEISSELFKQISDRITRLKIVMNQEKQELYNYGLSSYFGYNNAAASQCGSAHGPGSYDINSPLEDLELDILSDLIGGMFWPEFFRNRKESIPNYDQKYYEFLKKIFSLGGCHQAFQYHTHFNRQLGPQQLLYNHGSFPIDSAQQRYNFQQQCPFPPHHHVVSTNFANMTSNMDPYSHGQWAVAAASAVSMGLSCMTAQQQHYTNQEQQNQWRDFHNAQSRNSFMNEIEIMYGSGATSEELVGPTAGGRETSTVTVAKPKGPEPQQVPNLIDIKSEESAVLLDNNSNLLKSKQLDLEPEVQNVPSSQKDDSLECYTYSKITMLRCLGDRYIANRLSSTKSDGGTGTGNSRGQELDEINISQTPESSPEENITDEQVSEAGTVTSTSNKSDSTIPKPTVTKTSTWAQIAAKNINVKPKAIQAVSSSTKSSSKTFSVSPLTAAAPAARSVVTESRTASVTKPAEPESVSTSNSTTIRALDLSPPSPPRPFRPTPVKQVLRPTPVLKQVVVLDEEDNSDSGVSADDDDEFKPEGNVVDTVNKFNSEPDSEPEVLLPEVRLQAPQMPEKTSSASQSLLSQHNLSNTNKKKSKKKTKKASKTQHQTNSKIVDEDKLDELCEEFRNLDDQKKCADKLRAIIEKEIAEAEKIQKTTVKPVTVAQSQDVMTDKSVKNTQRRQPLKIKLNTEIHLKSSKTSSSKAKKEKRKEESSQSQRILTETLEKKLQDQEELFKVKQQIADNFDIRCTCDNCNRPLNDSDLNDLMWQCCDVNTVKDSDVNKPMSDRARREWNRILLQEKIGAIKNKRRRPKNREYTVEKKERTTVTKVTLPLSSRSKAGTSSESVVVPESWDDLDNVENSKPWSDCEALNLTQGDNAICNSLRPNEGHDIETRKSKSKGPSKNKLFDKHYSVSTSSSSPSRRRLTSKTKSKNQMNMSKNLCDDSKNSSDTDCWEADAPKANLLQKEVLLSEAEEKSSSDVDVNTPPESESNLNTNSLVLVPERERQRLHNPFLIRDFVNPRPIARRDHLLPTLSSDPDADDDDNYEDSDENKFNDSTNDFLSNDFLLPPPALGLNVPFDAWFAQAEKDINVDTSNSSTSNTSNFRLDDFNMRFNRPEDLD